MPDRKPLYVWGSDSDPRRLEALKAEGLNENCEPLNASDLEVEANRVAKESAMPDTAPAVDPVIQPKTPVFADKRLWVAVGTVVSLFASKAFHIDLSPDLLATIAVTIVTYITNSAIKEAAVSKAQIAAQKGT